MNQENNPKNIKWHKSHLNRATREELLKQSGCTIWFTGLPSSGKSTTAFTLEHELVKMGYLAYVLDGDNVRHGLNRNLGFSKSDREENIRRIAEVAKLFADAGVITIASFISPYRSDRKNARVLHERNGLPFYEVFIDVPVEVCEGRDPKGLYRKARQGIIKGFTGVDDPYETPDNPDIRIDTSTNPPGEIARQIIEFLKSNKLLNRT